MARLTVPPAIVILGPGALGVARQIQARYADAQVHALAGRVEADVAFTDLGAHLRALYASGVPIVALCAAGIVIRCLAAMLTDKGGEPPVLAVAEDGSAVVPLLGGLSGVNVMARDIGDTLGRAPAITTSGELRFGACVLNPPAGYALADIGQGKRFVSDLLAGETTRIEGDAPWLTPVALPRHADARRAIRITPHTWDGNTGELLIHPRSVVVALANADIECIAATLAAHRLSPLAVAALLAPATRMRDRPLAQAARALGVPLRFAPEAPPAVDSLAPVDHLDPRDHADSTGMADALLDAVLTVPHERLYARGEDAGDALAIAVAAQPLDPETLGQARGTLTVLGLGPGRADWMTPAARTALEAATDVLGYTTYVDMAGPLRADQRRHGTDNREEMQRARHAFELAAHGKRVVVVSSGDPGVFAMAAAVLEALEHAEDPRWAAVDLKIEPGVSAALGTAALAGAPLGHDFCMISLSDNLKPWTVIENRLRHAVEADLVMAFYNPISRARPWQLERALEIVRTQRTADTVVVLGRDVGRPGGTLVNTTLGALRAEQVDMRTMVIIGSSTTRRFGGVAADDRGDGAAGTDEWVYTPRSYPRT